MRTLSVDMISDVICPWCFLGKRRLDKAIALVPEIKVEVNFRPFFLDPTIPHEGLDREDYMVAKFGRERLKTIHDPLIVAGKDDGINYAFDKITRTACCGGRISLAVSVRWLKPCSWLIGAGVRISAISMC
jgi:predicted DsbA family dithiol-disulfide isomerase